VTTLSIIAHANDQVRDLPRRVWLLATGPKKGPL